METVIRQSMLIRDSAENIYTALTAREDIARWWGLVNEDADGTSVWYGMDREWAVPIVAMEPGKLLAFAFDAHHPHDHERIEPTQITFTITETDGASIVTVIQSAFSDADWNEMIHDGWVYMLMSLQLWVERGTAWADFVNEKKYFTYKHGVGLRRDPEWAWRALTDPEMMSTWYEGKVDSVAEVGGEISIDWNDDSRVGGEWVLLSEPRNLVCHWWDAKSLEATDDPGMITIQQWLVLPTVEGCVVTLQEYGYDRTKVNNAYFRSIEKGWKTFFGNLEKLANQPEEPA